MKLAELVKRYAAMSKQERLLLLASIASELTLAARTTYVVGSDAVADPPRLRAINEVQHRVVNFMRDVISGTRDRYPDDVFCQIVFESAQELQLSSMIDHAMSSLRAAEKRPAGGSRKPHVAAG